MREFYESTWERLGADLDPPLFERRRTFLLAHVQPGDRVLDLGCGDGRFCAELAAAGAEPVGADVAEGALRRARTRVPDARFELVDPHGPLPFADCEFDVVWSSEVIEHVADTARWLSELRRVLRPAGRLLLTTPAHGRLTAARIALRGFERGFDPRGEHLRFYTRRSLRELLDDFGFDAVQIITAGSPVRSGATLLASAVRA
jgi:ubiquinone/menaquinone biosynthesis C-methylase UbiE